MTRSPFLQSVESFMLSKRFSRRTVKTYLYWIKYFIIFNDKQHPSELGDKETERFLTFLAVEKRVLAATQAITFSLKYHHRVLLYTPGKYHVKTERRCVQKYKLLYDPMNPCPLGLNLVF